MKQMTCNQLGGPCDVVVKGNTAEELAKKSGDHVMSMSDDAHKKVAEKIKSMSGDDNKKWMADFQPKFDAAPEIE